MENSANPGNPLTSSEATRQEGSFYTRRNAEYLPVHWAIIGSLLSRQVPNTNNWTYRHMAHSHRTYEKRVVGEGYKFTGQIHVKHWQVIGKTQKELFLCGDLCVGRGNKSGQHECSQNSMGPYSSRVRRFEPPPTRPVVQQPVGANKKEIINALYYRSFVRIIHR